MMETQKAPGYAYAVVETAAEKMLTAGDSGGSSMERSGENLQLPMVEATRMATLAPSSNASGSPRPRAPQSQSKQVLKGQRSFKAQPQQPPQQLQHPRKAAATAPPEGGLISKLVDLLTCRSGVKQQEQQDKLNAAMQRQQQSSPPPRQQAQQRDLDTEDSWNDSRKPQRQPAAFNPTSAAQQQQQASYPQRQVSQQAISQAIATLAAVEIKKGKERDAAALAALKTLAAVAEDSPEGRTRLTSSGAVPPLLRLIVCCQEQGWPKWDAGQVTKRAADLLCLLSRDNLDFQLKLGVMVNVERGDRKLTPIFDATVIGYRTVADVLLRNGANINAVDSEGWTPLHHAAAKGDQALAKLFIKRGADTRAADNKGKTAEHVADQFGQWAMAEYLRNLRQAAGQ